MKPFFIQQDNLFAVPSLHYNMETAACVRQAILELSPDCIAVELAESMELQHLHAASRLPDISVVKNEKQYYMCEPCDGSYEGLRSALEMGIQAHCIDLYVENYPEHLDWLPDPYAIKRIGLKKYYETYVEEFLSKMSTKPKVDEKREMHMAKKLKELSLRYDKVLFIGGFYHIHAVLKKVKACQFPKIEKNLPSQAEVCTLTEESCRDVLAEFPWISIAYEEWRNSNKTALPDRQKIILELYNSSIEPYKKNTGDHFPGYHIRNVMKFVRNYALITNGLMPDLFQILTAAKNCVNHNYAYETWIKATEYPFLRNVDNLQELDLSIEEVWGYSKKISFHMKEQSRKFGFQQRASKDKSKSLYKPPGPFTICSYQPEDVIIENFGDFLKKKGTQILSEEGSRTVPFSTSIEDGIDTRETIRHWPEKKLYVKVTGKPPGAVGSIVVIFDQDHTESQKERYCWKTTWLGEHHQESDMAFYATPMTENVIGPGISRCEYGGFMMTYPPRRVFDIWNDPDYSSCQTKAEVLLVAAIDYSVQRNVVYVAATPPRSLIKSFAKRFGKKIIYIPIGQLSPITLGKIRVFHVLDGHEKRQIADEYIF